MHIVAATILYFILMFGTIFSWFVLGQYMVQIMVALSNPIGIAEVTAVTANCVLATHITFIFMLGLWTVWYLVMAHRYEYEQTFKSKKI